jgi:hypothetical protein
MSATNRVRKQAHLLTADDLDQHPLWEFCPDEEGEQGQDEATVKPFENESYPSRNYIHAADVIFSDGTSAVGYIYRHQLLEKKDMGFTQPTVVTESGQVNFWLGRLRFVRNPEQRIARGYDMLRKNPGTIFPVVFRTRPFADGAIMQVIVESFAARGEGRELLAVR